LNGITAGPDGNLWFTDFRGAIGRMTPAGQATEFVTGLKAGSVPNEITVGPDGNLWFTDLDGGVGRITPEGVITEFTAGITAGAQPTGITAGPDGNLWFTEPTGRIGRITTAGVVTEFSAGITAASTLAEITAGPDGNLWFTEQIDGARLGRITPTGVITEFTTGITAGSGPNGITTGPDGKLWFTEVARGIARADLHLPPPGAPATVTEFPVITPASDPQGITLGPDGNLWFTEANQDSIDRTARIGRITPEGTVTEFGTGLTVNSQPAEITTGPDGNLWFAEPAVDRIGRITTDGVVTEFSAGITRGAEPFGITAGPDGNLWFTETGGIGRITPAGTVTEFTAGVSQGSEPFTITAGPDGNLWFAEAFGGVGRITPEGVVTEFATTRAPSGITVGPDGNIWFTEIVGPRIGRLTPTGVLTEFATGFTAGNEPAGITAGPDGNLWFTDLTGKIGRITPTGVVTEFSNGVTAGSSPDEITTGPDGNLWFTESVGNRIARLTPPGPVGVATTTALSVSTPAVVVGEAVTLTTTVVSHRGTPTGTVTFFDGATAIGNAPLDAAGRATLTVALGVGVHNITVDFDGNATFTASTSPAVTETVNPQARATTSVALRSSVNPAAFGQVEALTAKVTSPAGTPSGTVTFFDGGTWLGSVPLDASGDAVLNEAFSVGVHHLTASYGGNAAFAASTSQPITEVVNRAPTAVSFSPSVNPAVFGQTVSLAAVVSSPAGAPGGAVTFLDGDAVIGSVTLNAAGRALLSVSLAAGTHWLSVSYPGNDTFAPGISAVTIETVNPSATTTAIVGLPSTIVAGQPVTLTASVASGTPGAGTPTGTITFKDGNTVIGVAAVGLQGTATITTQFATKGGHALTAVYSGDRNFAGSAQETDLSVVDAPHKGAIAFTTLAASASRIRARRPVVFTFTVRSASRTLRPTGTVTFMVGNVSVAQVNLDSRGHARWIGRFSVPGKVNVRALYSGDKAFAASSRTLTETVV
jgi:streptogramin lyase